MKGLLTSLITVLTFTGLQAQVLPATPKLVIGLTVDQLRTDYIEAFVSLYGEGGFKRLWREGRVYRNAEFNFSNVDRASSIAAIYTGTTSGTNGIIGENWLDNTSLRVVNCVDDKNFMGNYTDETSSASKLMVSTISDELKIATQGKGLVYAIAPYREAAILAAGHSGNGAFWLNDNTGKWCSTTYYLEFPWWMNKYNEQNALDFRIENITWTPTHPVTSYKFLGSEWAQEPFIYRFDDQKKNKYRKLISSPFINEEVNRLATECLNNTQMGKDDIPDMLSLTYYAGNYDHKSIRDNALEMQDSYVKLDKSIAALLDLVDKKVGLQNTLFFITSTGYTDAEAPDLNKYRIPGGEFHINRCAALLNMYLMALYGEGQYVEAYHGLQIYLNHKLLENKQLRLPEVLSKASDFLIQFSGVNEVYTSYRLLLGAWTPDIQRIRNGYNRKRSGDLLIDVLPGWTIME
ncbi:MAG: alkaline phosphatase family protein, partial [Bacteroidaceae bacterium]